MRRGDATEMDMKKEKKRGIEMTINQMRRQTGNLKPQQSKMGDIDWDKNRSGRKPLLGKKSTNTGSLNLTSCPTRKNVK